MSTDNLEFPEDLEANLGRLGNDAYNRMRHISQERQGKERAQRNIALGASALVQRKQDEISSLNEEEEQMRSIRERAARLLDAFEPEAESEVDETDDDVDVQAAPADAEEVEVDEDFLNNLYTRTELEGMSNQRLQALAAAYGMDQSVTVTNRERAIQRILAAQHRWCRENGQADPNGTAITATAPQPVHAHRLDPRGWGWIQWVSATVWALVAIWVAEATRDFPDYEGFAKGAFAFGWVVVAAGLGFFIGGLLGALVDEER